MSDSQTSGNFQCRFCGEELDDLIQAAKHGFFDHSPEGRWIKRRCLDTDS